MKRKYDTVLFDFDGTLFDTGEGILKSVQYAAESFGYNEPDLDALRSFVGPPLELSFARRYKIPIEKSREMVKKFRDRYKVKGVLECKPYPDIFPFVKELSDSGYSVCVATGKPTPYTIEILERYGYLNHFSAVLGSEFNGTRMEKSEVIAELLCNSDKSTAVMVGDRDNDVLGAKACGIPCIGVNWGFAEPGELINAGAIRVVDNVSELRQALFF
ncbi:MAG: HAD hydrolase-like protein [Ruminococcaceae bacterium]|nr:HAD hydrolase-like protein [Oscillospiraceae bacterium]